VLDGVDLEVGYGEVHALVGENGAGKTTLLKIISGRHQPTSGHIEIEGKSYSSLNPVLAQSLGISVVPQHIELVSDLSIADNIFLGRWPRRGLTIDNRKMVAESARVLSRVGVDLDPRMMVRDLSYVQKQMVEIARICEFSPRLIILDEPTAALSVREIETLFGLINQLRETGIGIIYVSHYLSELSQIADRISILRDGRMVAVGSSENFTTEQIVHHMVGDVPDLYSYHKNEPGPVVLSVQHARTALIRDISFDLRSGETLGIAAPKGEGISEFFRALCRVSGQLLGGAVALAGRPFRARSSAEALRSGVGYLSEERARWGLIRGRSVLENVSAATLEKFRSRLGILNPGRERGAVSELVKEFSVRTPGLSCEIDILSGGNQQKALLARLLSAHLPVYVLDDPTLGVDVRSKAEINRLISREVEKGAAVLLHSSDLDLLLNMSDRILLVHQGCITREFNHNDVSLANLERLVAMEMENEVEKR
ncbi:MAG: sugar ABC transporter ATP-binding protein, partial [Armatimonadetes bacterium]|nr:sugar ABC transporter ATP-binding protein [Armatimonadota bacterium]